MEQKPQDLKIKNQVKQRLNQLTVGVAMDPIYTEILPTTVIGEVKR